MDACAIHCRSVCELSVEQKPHTEKKKYGKVKMTLSSYVMDKNSNLPYNVQFYYKKINTIKNFYFAFV